MPSAAEVPSIETDSTVTPSTSNPLGVKGVGEAGTIGSAAAVINAVCDALEPARHHRHRDAGHALAGTKSNRGRDGGWGMIPAPFDYVRADSADAALAALGEHGDEAKLMAGGHSLIPLMRFRLVTPAVVVDVGNLNGDLRGIRVDGDSVRIGALTRHSELEHSEELQALRVRCSRMWRRWSAIQRFAIAGPSVARSPTPIRRRTCPRQRSHSVRRLIARGPNGEREIAIDDFFTGFLESSLAPDELLTEVVVPVSTGAGRTRSSIGGPRTGRSSALPCAEAGRGVALVNMGSTPLRASAVEAAVESGSSAADAAAQAAEGSSPPTDGNGDAAYRSHLARVLTERALTTAGVT